MNPSVHTATGDDAKELAQKAVRGRCYDATSYDSDETYLAYDCGATCYTVVVGGRCRINKLPSNPSIINLTRRVIYHINTEEAS